MRSLSPVDLPTLEQIVEYSPLTVLPDTPLIDVIALMNRVNSSIVESKFDFSSCVLVVEETNLIGILTLRDVIRLTGMGKDLSSVKISEVMTQPVISLRLSQAQNALTALSFMRQHCIRHLPVVDDLGQLVGLITQDRIRQVIQPLHLLKLRCVTEVMVTEVIHALPTTSVLELSQIMSDRQISCVVIVAEQKTKLIPVGMITEKDIIKFHLQGLDIAQTQAQDVMSTPVLSITPTESLWTVHQLMQERKVRRLTVVGEQSELQGLVTQTNLLQVLDPLEIDRVIQVLQAKVEEQTVKLRQCNQQLEQEVKQRRQAQQELELRVAERTAELLQANVRLIREIEERKQTEIALQQRENQWKALFDHALDAIAITDDEGRYIEVNPAACKLFGVSKEELLGSTIADFAAPEFDFTQAWQEFYKQGQMFGEFDLYCPDGTVRETEFAAVANFIPHRHLSILRDVSDRQAALRDHKQAEETLRESEQRLQLALSVGKIGPWEWNLKTNQVIWSESLFTLFGLTPDNFDVSYENFLNLIVHPEDRELLHESVLRAIDQQVPHNLEFRFIYPDGTVGWSVCKGQVLYDDTTNEPLQMIGVNIDITERKQAELEIRKFVSLTDNSTEFIGMCDMNFVPFYLNPAGMQLVGLNDTQQYRETPVREFFFPEDQDFIINEFFPRVLREGRAEVEIRFRHFQTGEALWMVYSVSCVKDINDQLIGLAAVSRNISDRKLAEQKIAEQAALIDIATDAIFVRDLENRILFWSRGAENLYGWTAEESMGKLAHELFQVESLSQLAAGLKTTLEQGSWQGELEKTTKTGRKIIVASRWTLVHNQFGQSQSILSVNTDITEKKQLEQQFYRAQRLESVGILASGIAHDLNNVFAPIIMIAQLLPLRCKNVDARTQELFKTLENSSQRGANLVKQILAFTRGTEGKRILLQPGHLLQELVKVIKQTFPKSIEIVNDIPINTLWMVQADPTQLEQVFMNLAVNARDAMPNDGMLTINAENRMIDETNARMHLDAKAGGYIVVTVSDTGTGIPPEFLERIFDPFFTTKEVGKGTGLGLSTVLGIVKNHGGFVEVSTQVGKGTQFQVFLPRGEGKATETITKAELPEGNGELILVVDDEDLVKQTNQETLEDYNYKTLVANDGIEAIALYAQYKERISVVLLDMSMPNMDGLTTISILRSLNPNIKIIATSGLPANEQKAIAVGAEKFLSKPYTATDLLTTLSAVIGHPGEPQS
ncbi:PAS domain S-box protein [Nostoc sp. ATCC 53789]|uniref:PAS domain S-box protein n=1 Tax=Nostoc sp. ATCC 53789 TaxID=76335 RepID=UPI000DEC06CB|nr:PAS domain S-box protein [Nostoc sp. ATCC 53789]QHG15155.1 PAS domain S-box protein [Nostoc sp. ATCC 53789]RCJ23709.1 histidine kinase [Nostoc sp. ATCC 53789]